MKELVGDLSPCMHLSDLEPGCHVCFIYDTPEERWAVVMAFLREGLLKNEKVLCILEEKTPEMMVELLREMDFVPDPFLEKKQLVFLRAEQAYMRYGNFCPEEMIDLLQVEVHHALQEGYSGFRVTGAATWALGDNENLRKLFEYETKTNFVFRHNKCLALCQYDRNRFDPSSLAKVLMTHPFMIVGTQIYRNPYYVQPEQMLDAGPDAGALERRLRALKESEADIDPCSS